MTTRTLRTCALARCSAQRCPLLAPSGVRRPSPRSCASLTRRSDVLDPGTTYIVDEGVTVPTRPDADCFGPPGGTGAEFTYDKPNVLSLLGDRRPDDKAVAPAGAHRPVRVRARGLRRSAASRRRWASSFWYFKVNHAEASVGADQTRAQARRRGPLLPRHRGVPEPEPGRARAHRACAGAGRRAVPGLGDRAQVRDLRQHAVRHQLHQHARPPG